MCLASTVKLILSRGCDFWGKPRLNAFYIEVKHSKTVKLQFYNDKPEKT